MSASDDVPGPFDDDPDVGTDTGPVPEHDVFISYSSRDRARVNGLRELLVGLGKDVYQDHVKIPAGRRWRAELDKGIRNTSTLVVFWTQNSAASDPVKREYEWFASKRRQRPLIPILADDTPLPPTLQERQAVGAYSVVNEVLEMKRDLKAEGGSADEVMEKVEARLKEAGVELDSKQKRMFVFMFLGFGLRETFSRYGAEVLKHALRLLQEKVSDYSRDIVMLTYASAIAIAAAHIFPVNDAVPVNDVPVDSPLVARLDSAIINWGDIANHFSNTFGNFDALDLDPLRDSLQAGVSSLSEQHYSTQTLLADIRARLDSSQVNTSGRGGGLLDSLVLAGLEENREQIESANQGVALVIALLREMDPAEVDLSSIESQLSVGFFQTRTLIDSVAAVLERLERGGTMGPRPYEGLSEADVRRVVSGELSGPRDTLDLIYAAVAGRSVGDPRVDTLWREPPDLSPEVMRILGISELQQDTIREILAQLRGQTRQPPPPTGVIRVARIYLPSGPGDFEEPTFVCSGEAPCETEELRYDGATPLVNGEVTVEAWIAPSGDVRRLRSVSVAPPGDETLPLLAERIVEGWRFRPGRLGGEPAEVQMFAIFVFVP